MKILARILALFLTMPVVELFLLIKLEEWADTVTDGHGLLATLGLIVITGVVGSALAKQQGLAVWNRLNARLRSGGLPGKELLDGVVILIAGALLITPGVLTDVVGFVGLIPFTRAPIRRYVMRRLQRRMEEGTMSVSFGSFGAATYDHGGTGGPQQNGWEGEASEAPSYRSARDRQDDDAGDLPPGTR